MRTASRVLVALCAAVFAALACVAGASASVAGTAHSSATLGIVAPSTTSAAQLAVPAPGAAARPRAARRAGRLLASAPTATSAPSAAPSALPPEASLAVNFNGVGSRDSAVTNFGAEFEPPDQGLCAGNGFVVEMVNSAYTVYDPAGKALAGPFNVNGPFEEGLTEFTSDPRCHYDAATNTWFATILSINKEENGSALVIAVNNSGDPRTPWTAYKVNTTGKGGVTGPRHPGCPCFGDQPTLGIDGQNVYVTTNEFSILGPQANGAQVYAFAKRDLVALAPVHFVHFDKLNIGGAPAASVQPALTTGNPAAEYFLNSIDPSETFDQRIGVWALTNKGAVARGQAPTLSSLVVGSEAFGIPPGGEQRGAESLIETGDDRMQQTQYMNGEIWGELDTAVSVAGDPVQRAGGAWFQLKASLSGGLISTAHIERQGYVAVPGSYVMYPAVQVTPSGAAVMGLSITSSKRFPSAGYATLQPGATAFGPVAIAGKGTGPYAPEAERWGDYSWAVLDPGTSSVWLAAEYVPPKPSQTLDGRRNWGTRVFRVTP